MTDDSNQTAPAPTVPQVSPVAEATVPPPDAVDGVEVASIPDDATIPAAVPGLPPDTTPSPPPFPPVAAADRLVDAAHAVIAHGFAIFLAHEPDVRADTDPEALHDMRVASRRLRVALQLFRDALPPRRVKTFRRELRRVGQALGETRDCDVHLAWLDVQAAQLSGPFQAGLQAYRDYLLRRRSQARRDMIRVLDSRRHAALLRQLQEFLAAGPPRRSTAAPMAAFPVRFVFPEMFERRLRKVIARAEHLSPESPDTALHRLRIMIKKLRYLGEFFRTAYGNKAMLRCHRRLVALQDALGRHQDCIAARDQLDRFLISARRPKLGHEHLYLALGVLVERNWREAIAARKDFFREWKRFTVKRQLRKLLAASSE